MSTTSDIGATIYSYLSANLTGVTVRSDYISPTDNGPLPAVTYTVVSTIPNNHLVGVSDCFTSRVELTVHAISRTSANDTAELVRQVMQSIPADTASNDGFITSVDLESNYYQFTEPSTTKAQRFHHVLDYMVSYRPDVLADLGL
jgi:hypothetical protein